MSDKRGRLLLALGLALVLVLGVVAPAMAHTGLVATYKGGKVTACVPYRAKLADGTYTAYKWTYRNAAGSTITLYSKAQPYTQFRFSTGNGSVYPSSMFDFLSQLNRKPASLVVGNVFLECRSQKAASGVYVKMVVHNRFILK